MRQDISFDSLPAEDQNWFLENTWCDICQRADLGVKEPREFRENGREFFIARCLVCGHECTTEVVIREIQGEIPR